MRTASERHAFRLDRRVYSPKMQARNGVCRFPVIMTGACPKAGLIGSARVDRAYHQLSRALLDNKGRVGSRGDAPFARHAGAWRMLRQRCRDSDRKEAWRHHNEMTARGYVRGFHGAWINACEDR